MGAVSVGQVHLFLVKTLVVTVQSEQGTFDVPWSEKLPLFLANAAPEPILLLILILGCWLQNRPVLASTTDRPTDGCKYLTNSYTKETVLSLIMLQRKTKSPINTPGFLHEGI